jgi:protein involved in polysaccharide export with SLBB domain
MKIDGSSAALIKVLGTVLCLGMLSSGVLAGQENSYSQRAKLGPKSESRAEQEAERLVSLSPDHIISILTQEPGLLLECKKLLVKTAYEQGRLLDFQDLNDDALFRLVRQDENIRVLFTKEIEDRSYVRAKPTREELEREWRQGGIRIPESTNPLQASALGQKGAKNQEDAYWLRRDGGLNQSLPPNFTLPSTTAPGTQQTNPQQNTVDPRRALLQAQAQSAAGDSGGMSADALSMPRISPDQLSALIDARMTTGSASLLGDQRAPMSKGLDMGSARGGDMGMSQLGEMSLGLGVDPYASGNEDSSQESRLDTSKRPPLPSSLSSLNEKQPALRRRPNPYADVPSLYDLYSQYAHRSPVLERFGADVFRNGTGNSDQLPMDLPVGPDYVLGPGDGLNIDLFGSAAQRLHRVVDREGRISLPEFGGVQVSGRSLGDVQHMVQAALRTQFRDVQADISLSRIRSLRVYVVGDVQRPGAYDVSSLSTPLNAVFESGGPTSRGSLRIIKHYRGKQLVQQVDVYDLLLHGVRSGLQRLESGDTILVPTLGPEVTVQGMVRRPAIYELNGEKSLAEVLEVAGGVLPSGTLRHVDVERLEAHESRSMLRLDIPENNNQDSVTLALENFKIQDGDRVQISPILPYANKTVYLDGHVFRPGKFAYRDGMKITDLIKSYKDLLPEPYKQHAEIIRLKAPDNTPEVMAFNLEDALAGKEQDLVLQPFDTVRVFGRFDFEDPPLVTVSGEVRDPGDHVTNGATYLRDAIYLAGNATPDAQLDDAQIFRKTDDGRLKVLSVNLSKALSGDPKDNILLAPKDHIFVHRNLAKVDPPTVAVQGEVGRPGKYPLGDGMTAADLVRFAGGLKRSAYTQEADLTRYMVEQSSRVIGEHTTIQIAKALAGEPDTDVRLHDGDVLTIRQLSGWNDMGATIAVKGEVVHPGAYGIQEGERLSSVIQRAGGFRSDAYPFGVIFERAQVRELEEKNRSDLIQRVRSEAAELKVTPTADQDQQIAAQASLLQYQTTLERLQNTPPSGRLVIHISSNMKRWANTPADIQVRAGDVIFIPKKPSTVMVDGSVYNPTAVTYKPGRSAGWYLRQAGGPTQMANRKAIFVIRADGSVVGGSGGLFSGGVESAALQPGDMVVVPEKAFSVNSRWKATLESAQLAYAVGVAIQVARSF